MGLFLLLISMNYFCKKDNSIEKTEEITPIVETTHTENDLSEKSSENVDSAETPSPVESEAEVVHSEEVKSQGETAKAETSGAYNPVASANPKSAVSNFMNYINSGKYSKALNLFNKDVLNADGISMDEFKGHVDRKLTKNKTMANLVFISEKANENNYVRIDFKINFSEGDSIEKWVLVKTVNGKSFLTTRGSMF